MRRCMATVGSPRYVLVQCGQWVIGKGTLCYAHDKAALLDLSTERDKSSVLKGGRT